MLAKHQLIDGPDDDAAYNQATLPSISFLPKKYYLVDIDTVITIRNMKRNEDRMIFDLINKTRNLGEGIAVYDTPNLAIFRRAVLLEGPCIVFEDSRNGAVIGFNCICSSWLMRSPQANCVEPTAVLDKQYQVNIIIGIIVISFYWGNGMFVYSCVDCVYYRSVQGEVDTGRTRPEFKKVKVLIFK